jgi:purine nucleoside phosphorylase
MLSSLKDRITHAVETVQSQLPPGWRPDIAVILGSGLGALADEIEAVAASPTRPSRATPGGSWPAPSKAHASSPCRAASTSTRVSTSSR